MRNQMNFEHRGVRGTFLFLACVAVGWIGCTMDDSAITPRVTSTSTGAGGGATSGTGKTGTSSTSSASSSTATAGGAGGASTGANTGGGSTATGGGSSTVTAGGSSVTAGSGGAAGATTGPGTGGAGGGGDDDAGPGGSTGTGGGPDDDASVGMDAPGDEPPAPSDLGKPCTSDAQCQTGAPGLTCIKATDTKMYNGGGPAHGYCSIDCSTDSQICNAYNGSCVNFAATVNDPYLGFCMQNCEFGSTDRPNKCRGRTDVACSSMDFSCIPVCGQDSDCPTGRKCDPGTGVCVDTPKAGDALGSFCESDETCSGRCIPMQSQSGDQAQTCTGPCVLGRATGCHFKSGALGAPGTVGACLFGFPNANVGDLGFCAELCDKASDCLDTTDTMVCQMGAVANHGYCTPGPAPDAGPKQAR